MLLGISQGENEEQQTCVPEIKLPGFREEVVVPGEAVERGEAVLGGSATRRGSKERRGCVRRGEAV